MQCLENRDYRSYWSKTGGDQALRLPLEARLTGLQEAVEILLEKGRIQINPDQYANDMYSFQNRDDVFTMMVHLGYLTFDPRNMEVFIPNQEVFQEIRKIVDTSPAYGSQYLTIIQNGEKVIKALWNRDADVIAKAVEDAHALTSDPLAYNSETALSSAVLFAFIKAFQYYTIIPQMASGKGYADFIMIPGGKNSGLPAVVLELKYLDDPASAIHQIKEKNYPQRLGNYKGNILLVGISYNIVDASDPEFKKHYCVIEEA